jgi:hypothetical protein
MIHQNHRIRSVLALTLALAAIGAAPAIAMPDNFGIPPSTVTSTVTTATSDPNLCSENSCSALVPVTKSGSVKTAAPKASHSSSFDWGTAAIIAGGAVILVLLAGGAVVATGARRTRRVPRTA